MKTFRPEVTWSTRGLYGGLGAFLVVLGLISYLMEREFAPSFIIALVGLIPLSLLVVPYRIEYILTEDSLVCKWPFGKKELPYNDIEKIRSYHLPVLSIRRFGISFVGGRYSNSDLGKFYAMFAGERDGLLIVSDPGTIYGGKIYIAPEDKETFLNELRGRTDAFIENLEVSV